jgi:hypothetical protein
MNQISLGCVGLGCILSSGSLLLSSGIEFLVLLFGKFYVGD